jgi:hypothetical protein
LKNYTQACEYLGEKGFLVGHESMWKSNFCNDLVPYSIHIHPEKKIIVSVETYKFDVINQSRIWACWGLKNTIPPEEAVKLWPRVGGFRPSWYVYDPNDPVIGKGYYDPKRVQMTSNSYPNSFDGVLAVLNYLEAIAQYMLWPEKPFLWFLNHEEVQIEKERGEDYETPSEKRLLSCLEKLSLPSSDFGF